MKALLLIDIQKGLTEKKILYNEELFYNTLNNAIITFRNSDSLICFIQHNYKQLMEDTPEWEIDSRIYKHKNDAIIQKKHGNAFQNTELKKVLMDFGIDSILVGGLVSHGCVKATCLGGLNEGFTISLLRNGHTNWNKDADFKITQTEEYLIKKRCR